MDEKEIVEDIKELKRNVEDIKKGLIQLQYLLSEIELKAKGLM